jgi:plasmid segregation protein ParM
MTHQKRIVRAIDIGYGNTKFVTNRGDEDQITCSLMPSIAPLPTKGNQQSIKGSNTVIVEVNGAEFEVGPGAYKALRKNYSRTLDYSFSMSDTYSALLKGALYFMEVDHLDMLVLGLPVKMHDDKELTDELTRRFRGTLHIANGRKVTIDEVWVLPQPAGGLFDYGNSIDVFNKIQDEINILIDPGYYTFDWWTSRGIDERHAFCGSYEGGVSAYLSAIAEQLGADLKIQIDEFKAIDDAILNNKPARFYGKDYDLTKYLPNANKIVEESVSALARSIGDGRTIDNMILVGGGAHIFKDAIRKKFPNHNLVIPTDQVYSNVRGFQYAGEALLMSEEEAV